MSEDSAVVFTPHMGETIEPCAFVIAILNIIYLKQYILLMYYLLLASTETLVDRSVKLGYQVWERGQTLSHTLQRKNASLISCSYILNCLCEVCLLRSVCVCVVTYDFCGDVIIVFLFAANEL